MSNNQEYDYLFKLLLIGNSSVGKSSLLVRFVDDIWEENFVPTIGVDFKLKTLEIDGKKVKLQIWDTAGQERFKNITASYYRGGNGVLVVYDITDRDSFNNLNSWLIEIEKNANKNVFKLLIGNKNDLESERKVSYNEGKEFADSNGMQFIETSAKTSDKVYDAFKLLTNEIIKNNLNKDKVMTNKGTERKIELNKGADLNKKKEKNCC